MKNIFNLGSHLKNIFAAKKTKTKDIATQIETKLTDKNKSEKEHNEITENQIDKDRKETSNDTIEKKLEAVRTGSEESLVEKQMDDSKSKLVQHRNADTASGNINKLEEQRVKKDNVEKQKPETASEVDEPRQFWKNKSPDGLKLASTKQTSFYDFPIEIKLSKATKIASETDENEDILADPTDEQFDFDVNEMARGKDTIGFNEELSPEALKELEQFNDADVNVDEEEKKKVSEDMINDPEFLTGIFSEEVVGSDSSTGTPIEERVVSFDLKNADGDVLDIFSSNGKINEDLVKKAILNFINITHMEEGNVNVESLHVQTDNADMSGAATYIVPAKA